MSFMKNKKKSCIVFLKNENDGSSYYRLFQYMKNCRIINMTPSNIYWFYYGSKKANNKIRKLVMGVVTVLNVLSTIILDNLIWKSRTVIINRRFFPRSCPKILELLLERYLNKRRLYWDFDDNIIFDGEISQREALLLEKKSDGIIVTNEYLANTISTKHANKVKILATTDCEFENIDIEISIAKRKSQFEKEIVICWVGTMNNLQYLVDILPALDEVARYCKDRLQKKVRLKVVANKKVDFNLKYLYIENIEWTRQKAITVIENSHIGLMPLIDDEYTRGKGGFKAIQYMSAGVVPILSDVGYNVKVAIEGESGIFCKNYSDWKEKIILVSKDLKLWETLAKGARLRWLDKFNPRESREFWSQIIEEDI